MKREHSIRPPALTRRKGPDYGLYEALKAAARHQATDSADYARRIREAARLAGV